MTPERIEKLMQGCYASGGPDSETIRAALRQCAREAVDGALERAAKVCDSVNNFDNPMTANDCADAIRALKGKP